MSKPLLEVKELSIDFHGHQQVVHAVKNISFSVFPNEIVGVVGMSGCGKTATAMSILQLIPPEAGKIVSGEILFNEINLLRQSEQEMQSIRGKQIGMIFQDPMTSLNPTMKIGHQITEILRYHEHLTFTEARHKTLELMNQVEIPDSIHRIDQYPFEFSGGMRQRVMIAIALACSPSLLIADEPTTALDVTIQAQILDLLKQIQKKLNTAIIFITHDLGVVARICDRVIIMEAGEIVESGSCDQIFYSPQHLYTKALIQQTI